MKDYANSSSFQKNINVTATEISKLTLIIIDAVHMVVGSEYEIYPNGLKSSKRNVKDGCVYAGSVEKFGRLTVNDIILSEKEKGIGKRHFMINYNKGKKLGRPRDLFFKRYGRRHGDLYSSGFPNKT